MRRVALLSACLFLCAAGSPPSSERGYFGRVWTDIVRELEKASKERAPVPPVPVKVSWGKRKLGSVDLGAPLLALDVRDLDGDGRAEIVGLTSRELVILAPAAGKLGVEARAALPPKPPPLRPRHPVGALAGAGAEIVVRTSEQAEGAVYSFGDSGLQEARRIQGFPLCDGGRVELEPGRNLFVGAGATFAGEPPWPVPDRFYAAGCASDLVDPEGWPLQVFAVVNEHRTLTVSCRAAEGRECPEGAVRKRTYDSVGYAFEVADVDRDGNPEVITSSDAAPGDPDRVSIYALRGEEVDRVFDVQFQGGVVGVSAGDLDGDGAPDLVAAVRLVGSDRVDLWTLN